MRPLYRIKLPVAIAVVVAGVALVGWVARSSRAQERPPEKASPATPAEPSEAIPPGPKIEPAEFAPKPPAAELPLPAHAEGAASLPPAGAGELTTVDTQKSAATPPGPQDEDPEKSVRAFVEQNRKVAQEELKKLKDEAERLRARLGKVEGGIRRWETLLTALENSEKTMKPAFKPVSEKPTELEPTLLEPAPRAAKEAPIVRDSAPPSNPPPLPR